METVVFSRPDLIQGDKMFFFPLMFYVYIQPYGHDIPALPLLPYTSLLVSCKTTPFVPSISKSSHRSYCIARVRPLGYLSPGGGKMFAKIYFSLSISPVNTIATFR